MSEAKRGLNPSADGESPLQVQPVSPDWSEEDLLSQDAVFYLHDVADKLEIPTAVLKRQAADLERTGGSPWDAFGLRRVLRSWVVRMGRFADHYRREKRRTVREVKRDWDANAMLAQQGLFYLADVCEKLPFSQHQMRHQARRARATGEDLGVWKDQKRKAYLVRMETFSEWLKEIWLDTSKARN